ncbi:MAG: thymidylate kinase [Candidatus Sulfotelmatobacter sp.]
MKIVSFSGIDGAGKSTQIHALETWLLQSGLRVKVLTFWDDVVVFQKLRESMSHAVFKGDRGVGSPEKPLNRRDKNVTSWHLTVVRMCLYFLDALNVRLTIRKARSSSADVVIFDRYIYDELANLPLSSSLSRVFIRFLLKLAPMPDVSYVIDADPVAALARKPEYPLEFLRRNREAYLTLSSLSGAITVVEPLPVEEAEKKVRESIPADGLRA